MDVPCPPAWLSVPCRSTLELWQRQHVSSRAIKMLVPDEADPKVPHVSNTEFVKLPGRMKLSGWCSGGNKEDSFCWASEITQAVMVVKRRRKAKWAESPQFCWSSALAPSECININWTSTLIVHKRREKKSWSCWRLTVQPTNHSFTGNNSRSRLACLIGQQCLLFSTTFIPFLVRRRCLFSSFCKRTQFMCSLIALFLWVLLNGAESRGLHSCIEAGLQL